MHPKTKDISISIKKFAKSIGIDLIGFAPAIVDLKGEKNLKKFIDEGRHGAMSYLEDYKKRAHPQELLPGTKSVIVIGINYYQEVPPTPKRSGRIARYAYGKDYHKVIKKLLKELEKFIKSQCPDAETDVQTKICVDSAPLLEKSYAVQAGLGFIGKNTNLITKEFGSYILLGEILTTLKLPYDKPTKGTCGTCTRCLDACPTQALTSPQNMDARRCISYLTIENKGPIPKEFHKQIGNRIFGCDACQEICPYNKVSAKPTKNPSLNTRIAGSSIPLETIIRIKTDQDYLGRFAGSPLMRAKRAGLTRNAKIALKNQNQHTLLHQSQNPSHPILKI